MNATDNEQIDDGGPAFSRSEGESSRDGMSLRDYFAAAAIGGIWAGDISTNSCYDIDINRLAELAYRQADAMIAARR